MPYTPLSDFASGPDFAYTMGVSSSRPLHVSSTVFVVGLTLAAIACSNTSSTLDERFPAPTTGTGVEDSDAGSDSGTTPVGSDSGSQEDAYVAPLVETPLSDLPYTVTTNGFGPVEKDKSLGNIGAGDGVTLTLEGKTYEKGLGAHAPSEIVVPLEGKWKRFRSDVGVDDESMANGSVVFEVYVDNILAFDSGPMTGSTPTRSVDIPIIGVQELKLVVTDGGDGISNDHADWAGARLGK